MAIQVAEGKNLQYISTDYGAISTEFRYMSDPEEFIYLRWMFHYMNHGTLPVDKLERIAHASSLASPEEIRAAIDNLRNEGFFTEVDGQVVHKVWEAAVKQAKQRLEAQIKGGLSTAEKRYPQSTLPKVTPAVQRSL